MIVKPQSAEAKEKILKMIEDFDENQVSPGLLESQLNQMVMSGDISILDDPMNGFIGRRPARSKEQLKAANKAAKEKEEHFARIFKKGDTFQWPSYPEEQKWDDAKLRYLKGELSLVELDEAFEKLSGVKSKKNRFGKVERKEGGYINADKYDLVESGRSAWHRKQTGN